jgi:uncharacterized integral membrane protein
MTGIGFADSMQKILHYLGWLARLLVFLVALGFALKNTHPVTFVSYLGYAWQAPLIVMLLVAFVAGALAGILALLPHLIRLRRQAARARNASSPGGSPESSAQ